MTLFSPSHLFKGMVAEIDQVRIREPAAEESPDPHIARVDISDRPPEEVKSFVSTLDTSFYVERRAGHTYLVAEDDAL